MIRGSESAEHTLSTSREPRGLNKQEFAERVAKGARRWGQPFREALLNEFIKQGLIAPATRGPNFGRKPTYVFGCNHYRRAMQLMRLRSAGIRDCDALFVQLFIRGYRIEVETFKAAIIKEAERAAALINGPIRSAFADRGGPIPPKRLKSLLAQIGNQDSRFIGGQYELPPTLPVEFLRIARLPPDHERNFSSSSDISPRFQPFARLFEGLLLFADRQSRDKTTIASLIEDSDRGLLMNARAAMTLMIAGVRRGAQIEARTSDRLDVQAVAMSWWQRESIAMMFIVTLNALIQNRPDGQDTFGSEL